jgi:cephalosporin hydroxylase
MLNFNQGIPIESCFALMSNNERHFLYSIISELSDNSVVVEVGSHLGGSACTMAAVNPTIYINCIEMGHEHNILMWEYTKSDINTIMLQSKYDSYMYIKNIDDCFVNDSTGIDALKYVTQKYSNIQVHQGKSPEDFLNWSQPIDLYFEDAVHSNPQLNLNLKFWCPHIKLGGYLVGHDYNDVCPDVISEFNKFISVGWILIAKVDSLIILQKPNIIEENT